MQIRTLILACTLILLSALTVASQGRRGEGSATSRHTVYGDVKIEQGPDDKPITLDFVLFNEYGNQMQNQRVQSNGRYRFVDVSEGRYYISVQYEGAEVERFIVDFSTPLKPDFQRDVTLEARGLTAAKKAAVISAADKYDRQSKNSSLFSKAQEALKNKKYDEASGFLHQIVEADSADFPAWFELGNVYFSQKNYPEADKAYTQAIAKHPNYVTAMISLGRLRIASKNLDGAIEVLNQAVKAQPDSAQANYFLGEAYLQNKKGSLGVGYLNEAIKLDPVGMAEAHLRLAALYNAVGMKDKAALEYEAFLKKVPNYPEKKKLEEYVTANKKP